MIELLQFYKIKSCKKKEKFLWKEKIKYKITYIIKKEKILAMILYSFCELKETKEVDKDKEIIMKMKNE